MVVRGSGSDTEGDTHRVEAGMLTCVTDGRRARQAKEYESHPRTRARLVRPSCARNLRRLRVPRGNLKFGRRSRLVMNRNTTCRSRDSLVRLGLSSMDAGPARGAGRHFGERSRALMISNSRAGRLKSRAREMLCHKREESRLLESVVLAARPSIRCLILYAV